jgi:hypothetical protein
MPVDALPCPDRRTAVRSAPPSGVVVACRPGWGGSNVAVALADLSPRGCRLHVAGWLARGQTVAVALRPAGGGAEVRLAGWVAWVRPASGDAHTAGVAFAAALPDDTLAALAPPASDSTEVPIGVDPDKAPPAARSRPGDRN